MKISRELHYLRENPLPGTLLAQKQWRRKLFAFYGKILAGFIFAEFLACLFIFWLFRG